MKILIAIVMFLFGLFIGILVVPTFKEFSTPMFVEEEYSVARIKTILQEFGIASLPPEASNVSLFMKQDGEKRQLWVRFECPAEAKSRFVEDLSRRHSGRFNHEIELPKMHDGTPITWWTYSSSSARDDFADLCIAYDELAQNLCFYAISEVGEKNLAPAASDSASK